ncbi:MAG: PHP domain-containing protein [bacterium]
MKEKPVADLHTHTSYSDSKESPKNLVERARRAGLRTIAVTDHDTVSGLEDTYAASRKSSVSIVPGVELSTRHKSVEVHVVGLWIDPASAGLKRIMDRIEKSRVDRAMKMVERLAGLGAAIDFSDVESVAGKGVIGRPHVAQALVDRGRVDSFHSAFRLYIGREGPAYVRKLSISPADAIEAIHGAGGVAVMAHPLVGGPQREHVRDITAMGLDAVEVSHPKLSANDSHWLREYAAGHGLAVSGGSDWHGEGWSEGEMGDYGLNERELQELYSRVPVSKSIQGGKNV